MLPEYENPAPLQDPLELRSNPRVAADLPVEIYATDFGGALPGRTRELSIGGACVATASPFAIKSLQHVVLALPSGRLKLPAEGMWQRECAGDDLLLTGVRFEECSVEALDALWELVFSSGRSLARFLHERSELHELGLEEAFGLAQLSRYRVVPAGRTVYRQDDPADRASSLFLVVRGSVALQARVRGAIETETERVRVGDLFGGMALLADVPSPESAITVEDSVLLELDAGGFRHLRLTKPWLAYRLGQTLIRLSAHRLQRLLARARDEL